MSDRVYWCLHNESEIDPDQQLLSFDEEKVYQDFRFAARRKSWLVGRFAAKKLISEIFDGGYRHDQIEISNDALGAPGARITGQSLEGYLSISHSGGWAAAAYAPCGLRIGIDLEAVSQRSDTFLQDYFTSAELNLLAHLRSSPDKMATVIWSAKEAMLKAMGVGLRVDTRQVQVESVDGDTHLRQAGWFPLVLSSKLTDATWIGYWRDAGNFVITLVAISNTASEVDLIEMG